MKTVFIYLASQSPRRSDILREMGIPFRTVASDYSEKPLPGRKERPSRTVLRHAEGKARMALIPHLKPTRRSLVLGADTLVYFRGRALGKPASYRKAEALLMAMRGKSHWVYTGIALKDPATGRLFCGYEKSRVLFHNWTREKIKRYVKAVNALDKAGAYAIQMQPCIVKRFSGSRTNIIGLPRELLLRLLKAWAARQDRKTVRSRERTTP